MKFEFFISISLVKNPVVKLDCRDKHVSAIVAMTASGTLDYKLTRDTVDSDEFGDFVEGLNMLGSYKLTSTTNITH